MPLVVSRVIQTFGVILSWFAAAVGSVLLALVNVIDGPFQIVAACTGTDAAKATSMIIDRQINLIIVKFQATETRTRVTPWCAEMQAGAVSPRACCADIRSSVRRCGRFWSVPGLLFRP